MVWRGGADVDLPYQSNKNWQELTSDVVSVRVEGSETKVYWCWIRGGTRSSRRGKRRLAPEWRPDYRQSVTGHGANR